jgi:phage baseplate assembly protein W
MSRADRIQQLTKPLELFSDFLNNFDAHPVHGTLGRVTNEESIKQSIKNIILTNAGERLFAPNLGSNVYRSLFEPNDIITQEDIVFHINTSIRRFEPRALLMGVIVNPSPDENAFNVSIVFSIINNPKEITLDLVLRRVR